MQALLALHEGLLLCNCTVWQHICCSTLLHVLQGSTFAYQHNPHFHGQQSVSLKTKFKCRFNAWFQAG